MNWIVSIVSSEGLDLQCLPVGFRAQCLSSHVFHTGLFAGAPSDPLEMLFPLPPALPSQESFALLLTAVEGCLSVKASDLN